VSDERYCANCRAELPKGATVCPVCGVYAGDVFDGRLPRKKGSTRWIPILFGVIAVISVATIVVQWPALTKSHPARAFFPGRAPAPVHAPFAKDLPGEAGAMLSLRQQLVSDQIPNECLALMSKGLHEGAYSVRAVDRCKHRQLGEWKIDAKTHAVSR
jgi:hypothetical protein